VPGFRVCFTPRQGYFSVFARATRSLSVSQEYVALESGLPRFTQDFTSLALLRYHLEPTSLRVRGYHPLWPTFPGSSARVIGLISVALQPQSVNRLVWADPRSLAATDGISVISFPRATKMFQFTRLTPLTWSTRFAGRGCPIRTFRDHRLGAPPPDFSQLSTSFIAFESLTIHPAPLNT
jgi:hypothetical protein